MYAMFRDTLLFNSDIGGWSVSNVTNFGRMFYNATSFNQDLTSWTIKSGAGNYRFSNGSALISENIPDALK